MPAPLDLGSRYRLVDVLGEGGMGTVYLADDLSAGHPVAMKVMSAALADGEAGEENRLRFKQEFRIMARLRHPNTCEVYDFGNLPDGRPYMTMEVVAGQGLDALIPLAPARLLDVLGQVGAALAFIHRQGFVHLDLKPDNIRVRADGVVKLMDFGLMEVAGQALGAVRGTLLYLSPEVARQDRVDQRSDLYSLGAVAYHALAGRPPFTGATPLQYLRAHLTETPRPLRELAPEVPPAVEAAILKLLAKEPMARFQSAGDALAALGLTGGEGQGAALLASAFVGRQAELARLAEALAQVRQGGPGRAVWLGGDAGVGRTRLLGELRVQVLLEEVPFLAGTCTEQAPPYGPFVEALRAGLAAARLRCPDLLHEHGPLLAKLLPELADGRQAPTLEPEQEKILLQAAFAEILTGLAAHGAVLAFDDWHLADPLSADALKYLLRRLERTPLLVVATARPEAEPPAGFQAFGLAAFAPAEAAAMAESMLGGEALPPAFAAALHEASAGVPLVVAALLEHLLRTGVIARAQGRWVLPDALPAGDLPTGAADMLLARVAALPPEARALADFAAVFGEPFALQDAKLLLAGDDEALFDALDALLQARVLDETDRAYALSSSALRHALYARVAPEARRDLHTAIAGYLEGRLPAGEAPPLATLTAMARHHLAGAEAARAVRWALVAAQRNLEVIASGTARTLLEAGLARLDEAGAEPAVRLDYVNALATALHWQHAVEPARALLEEALAPAEALGDKARLLELLVTAGKNAALRARNKESAERLEGAVALADELGNERTAARARVNLGRNFFFMGANARAREIFEQAATQARAAELPGWHASALAFLGYLRVLNGPSTRERGFADLEDAVAIQERIGDRGGVGYSSNLKFEVQLQAGRLREAEASAVRNAEIAQELGIADDHTIALLNHAIVCMELGELDRATASGERCLRLAEQHRHTIALPIARAVLGLVALWRGDLAGGIPAVRAAEAEGRETSPYVHTIILPFCIDAYLLAGRLSEALNAAQALQALLGTQESAEGQARLAGLMAEIHTRMGQTEPAEKFAEQAIRGAMELDAKGMLARALAVRAGVARRAGHGDYAIKLAERALVAAEAVGGRYYPALATAELAEAALAKGWPEAAGHFQALLAAAEAMDVPAWRAQARFGLSATAPTPDAGAALLAEAQRGLRAMAAGLPDEEARLFLDQPAVRRVLDKIPGLREAAAHAPEASELTFERLQRVSGELQSVADQYGLLFKEWSTKSEQLERLNELARQINETLVIEDVLDQVVRLTLDITRAERGFIFLTDPERPRDLILKAAFNQFGRPIPTERCAMSICQRVVDTGESVAVMDASADEAFKAHQSIAALHLRTVMCVPLQAKGQPLGVLYVDSQAVVTTFSEKDLALLRGIASHAAVALENAVLYDALNKRAAELERALELYRQADYEASTDVLTGLRNRRFFEEQAGRELDICRRYARSMSVLAIDVDHFKKFNDTYGHAVGDAVLKAVGRVLAASVRDVDLPARLGGEEFVVLCPDTDTPGAVMVAERIRNAVKAVALGEHEGKPIPPIHCSIGVATFRARDVDLAAVIARADAALYAAKHGGRDQVQAWTEAMAAPA